MKRHGILNSDIARVLSCMGHTDRLCIGDCGLPIREVAGDMKIEKIILAEEIKEKNPRQLKAVTDFFKQSETGFEPEIEYVSHAKLKELTKGCKAVIRTGETTPFSNIILQSGCIF